MAPYQRITLATNEPEGTPGPLPPELDGLEDISLVDLSWVPPSMGYSGVGYWPVDVVAPAIPEVHTTELILVSVIPTLKRCVAEYAFVPIEDRKTVLTGLIRDIRWTHEQAGFDVSGGHQRTDAETQNRLASTVMYMDKGSIASVDWEQAPGIFDSLSAQDVIDLAISVNAHVQACFTQSRVLTDAVQAATTQEELSVIDINQGWPPP